MELNIKKITIINLDMDEMEKVNQLSGAAVSEFETNNWCDLSTFKNTDEKLKNYITPEQYEALKNGQIDYIVFKAV